MASLILGAITVGWIVWRLFAPARWQEFGFLGAIALAVIPTLMGLRQDPTVQTVILPAAGGLVLGDVCLRLVQWVVARAKQVHARATHSPLKASEPIEDERPRRRTRSSDGARRS